LAPWITQAIMNDYTSLGLCIESCGCETLSSTEDATG
jgi:hypothetical protein